MSLCGNLFVILGVLLALSLGSSTSVATNQVVDLIGESDSHSVSSPSASTFSSPPIITTIAGSGISGPQSGDFAGDGSSAKTARLFSPEDVAVGRDGRIYIADKVNHRIRMISEGIMSTVAGTGAVGYTGDNGPATSASLYYPGGVSLFVDDSGEERLLISDSWNNRVRSVLLSTGVISTLAGNGVDEDCGDHGPALEACINNPLAAVAYSSKGDRLDAVLIADAFNNKVKSVSLLDGKIVPLVGMGRGGIAGDGGPAIDALIFRPTGLAVENNGFGRRFYIADSFNNRIRRVSLDSGIIETVAGRGVGLGGDGGLATSALFYNPMKIAVDCLNNIYISDHYNHRIRFVNSTTGIISSIAGNVRNGARESGYGGSGHEAQTSAVDAPMGVFVDRDNTIYLADQNNHRIRTISPLFDAKLC